MLDEGKWNKAKCCCQPAVTHNCASTITLSPLPHDPSLVCGDYNALTLRVLVCADECWTSIKKDVSPQILHADFFFVNKCIPVQFLFPIFRRVQKSHFLRVLLAFALSAWASISTAVAASCLVRVALRPWPSIFARLRLQPHLSPSRGRRGYNSPKRSRFLVDLRMWYLGGRGSLAGTLSYRWLRVDRPCSPMRGPLPYRSGTCTRHSVPMLPGNAAWRVPHCCRKLAEWTTEAKASLISLC